MTITQRSLQKSRTLAEIGSICCARSRLASAVVDKAGKRKRGQHLGWLSLWTEAVAQTIAVVSDTQPIEAAVRTLAIYLTYTGLHRQSPGPRSLVAKRYLVPDHNRFPVRRLCATASVRCGSEG